MHNLLSNVAVRRVMNAVAAGQTDQTSSAIDTQGYDGVMIIASVGTLSAGAVTSLRAQSSSDDGGSDAYADLAGSDQAFAQATDSNKQVVLDIFRPRERYIKAVLKRATGNAVIDGITAILYRSAQRPVVQGSTVAKSKSLNSPAEGTA